MPGIDYHELRRQITMREVLDLLGFQPRWRRGPQLRGPCPLPGCSSSSDRCFSVHLARQVYRCFACRSRGNTLDLWAAARRLRIYQAAVDLCRITQRTIPSRAPLRNR